MMTSTETTPEPRSARFSTEKMTIMFDQPADAKVLSRGRIRVNWDRLGIWLSSFCVLHCIATPFFILLLPVIGLRLGALSETFHVLMATVLLPVALIAFYRGYKHHGDRLALVLGSGGIVVLILAVLTHDLVADPYVHTAINIAGSIALISGHIRNRYLCRRCQHDH